MHRAASGEPDRERGDGEPLSVLFERMRVEDPEQAREAWGECYRQFHRKVWARVFYVLRTVNWLAEPSEAAADVTSQVFLGLPDALRSYREIGRAEAWLMRVALRSALRHREALTGNWSSGRSRSSADRGPARVHLGLDELVHEIAAVMDDVDVDERLELRRRLAVWESQPAKRRWLEFIDLFLQGYSHEEISKRIGITPGTSRNLLWKIRQELGAPVAAAGDLSEPPSEVEGREATPRPLNDRLTPAPAEPLHPDPEEVLLFADAMADPEAIPQLEAHLARCGSCRATVDRLRRGLAILALSSDPPPDLLQRIARRWDEGERSLIPRLGWGDPVAPDIGELREVAGRDLAADDPDADRGPDP